MLLAGLFLLGLTTLAGCPAPATKSVARPKPTQAAPTARSAAADAARPTPDAKPRAKDAVAKIPVSDHPSPYRVGDRLPLKASIEFDYNKARIRPSSYLVLDELAALLKEHPELILVEVQNHSDNTIRNYYGRRPTRDRAMSVRRALIARGIAPERLTAKGYGEERPIATNKTAAGRAKNRRTEIVVLKMR